MLQCACRIIAEMHLVEVSVEREQSHDARVAEASPGPVGRALEVAR